MDAKQIHREPQPSGAPVNTLGCPVSQPPRELDINSLYGSPLIQELVKLASTTVGFHIAAAEGRSFTPPAGTFRTTASINELMRFALIDTAKPHIVMYAREVLRHANSVGATSELDFAKIAVTKYCDMQNILAGNSSWPMPTQEEALKQIGAACSRTVTFEELKRLGGSKDPCDITTASMGARPKPE